MTHPFSLLLRDDDANLPPCSAPAFSFALVPRFQFHEHSELSHEHLTPYPLPLAESCFFTLLSSQAVCQSTFQRESALLPPSNTVSPSIATWYAPENEPRERER